MYHIITMDFHLRVKNIVLKLKVNNFNISGLLLKFYMLYYNVLILFSDL